MRRSLSTPAAGRSSLSTRVTIDAEVWTDPRFDVLAHRLGIDKPAVVGRMAALWGACTLKCAYSLPVPVVATVLACPYDEVVEILVASGLGEDLGDGLVRLCGTEGRIEWLQRKRNAGKKGGSRSKPKAQPKQIESTPASKPKAQPKQTRSKPKPSDSDSDSDEVREREESLVPPLGREPPARSGALSARDSASPMSGPAVAGSDTRPENDLPSPERVAAPASASPGDGLLSAASSGASPPGSERQNSAATLLERATPIRWENRALTEQTAQTLAAEHNRRRSEIAEKFGKTCRPLRFGVHGKHLDAIKRALCEYSPAELTEALDVAAYDAEKNKSVVYFEYRVWESQLEDWLSRTRDDVDELHERKQRRKEQRQRLAPGEVTEDEAARLKREHDARMRRQYEYSATLAWGRVQEFKNELGDDSDGMKCAGNDPYARAAVRRMGWANVRKADDETETEFRRVYMGVVPL